MAHNKEEGRTARAARMDAEHVFRFRCSPGVPCFTECCQDVTIVLTPYDVLRLKNARGMSSDAFLDRHTITLAKERRLIPMVVLKMNEQDKKCPFVTEKGCTVYEDRPWPCRMFPLDVNDDGTFSLVSASERCLGLNEPESQRIGDWLVDQGVPIYEEMNTLFTQITSPLRVQEPDINNPQIFKMVFMSLYNLDKFRDFIFGSTFLDRFDIEPQRIEKMRRSDIELLKFAFDWIKFGIFGQKVLQVKPGAHEPQASSSR